MAWWRRTTRRYRELIAEFGAIAVVVHTTVFLTMLVGVAAAVELGAEVPVGGRGGSLAVGYLATQLTHPVRLGITAALTPIVAAGIRRRVTDRADRA